MSVVKFDVAFVDLNFPNYPQIKQLINYGRKLSEIGVAEGSSGNISCRTKDGFIISCANSQLGNISKEEFSEVIDVGILPENKTKVIARGTKLPSSETPIHWIVYQLKPEVNFVFHIHDKETLKFAEKLDIPVTEKFQISGTVELMQEVERFITRHPEVNYFCLQKHGSLVMGKSAKEAFNLALKIHRKAQKIARKEE